MCHKQIGNHRVLRMTVGDSQLFCVGLEQRFATRLEV